MSDITENTVESTVENTQEPNATDNSQELINELKQRLEQAEKQLLEVKEESIGRRKKLKNEKQEKETVLSEKQQLELEMDEMKKQKAHTAKVEYKTNKVMSYEYHHCKNIKKFKEEFILPIYQLLTKDLYEPAAVYANAEYQTIMDFI